MTMMSSADELSIECTALPEMKQGTLG